MMAQAPIALIGGGGRGIGAATARRLAAGGGHVVVVDLFRDTPDDSVATVADREALEGVDGIDCVTADLRDVTGADSAVTAVVERHGHLDIAISCAGAVGGGPPLWESDPTEIEALWRSNTVTAWNLAHASIPHLLARPAAARPAYVALTSTAGSRGLFGLSGYVVAKHATTGVVRALAADLTGTAVTACGVAPGATNTAMLRATAALYGIDDPAELAADQHGTGPLDPDDVAAVVALAATAGPAVHGAVLSADGGLSRA